MDGSLFGFGMGMIFAVFQVLGIVLVFNDLLYMCVRRESALVLRCLRCLTLILSGPVELLFLACLMACVVLSMVIWMGVVFRALVFLSILRLLGFVLWVTMFVNWMLKDSAFCLCVRAVPVLNVMVVLAGCGGFLLFSPAIVCHRMFVLVLWSQSFSKCSLQISVLWFCICRSISALRLGMVESWWLLCLMVFLSVIRSRIV